MSTPWPARPRFCGRFSAQSAKSWRSEIPQMDRASRMSLAPARRTSLARMKLPEASLTAHKKKAGADHRHAACALRTRPPAAVRQRPRTFHASVHRAQRQTLHVSCRAAEGSTHARLGGARRGAREAAGHARAARRGTICSAIGARQARTLIGRRRPLGHAHWCWPGAADCCWSVIGFLTAYQPNSSDNAFSPSSANSMI